MLNAAMPEETPEGEGGLWYEYGDESLIRPVAPDEDFLRMVLCMNVDGTIDHPQEEMWAAVNRGLHPSKSEESHDGVYCNPAKRFIAGADGITRSKHPAFAAGLILASAHLDAVSDGPFDGIPETAANYLADEFRKRGIPYFLPGHERQTESPAATFGCARESTDAKRKYVDVLTVGDYRAIVIDLNAKRILHASEDQVNWVTMKARHQEREIIRLVKLGSHFLAAEVVSTNPQMFRAFVPPGAMVLTILCSDGVKLTDEEILELAATYPPHEVGREIFHATLNAQARYCEMDPAENPELMFFGEGQTRMGNLYPDIRDHISIATMVSRG